MPNPTPTQPNAAHYTYRVTWSTGDDEYVATVAEFPRLSVLQPDPDQAIRELRELVADCLIDMAEVGEDIPVPFSERQYSGRILVRMSSELHRQLVVDANEKNVSLNHHVLEKLRS